KPQSIQPRIQPLLRPAADAGCPSVTIAECSAHGAGRLRGLIANHSPNQLCSGFVGQTPSSARDPLVRALEAHRTTASTLFEAPARTITRPRPHTILMPGVRRDLDRDLAEAVIRVRLRIVRHGVAVAQILADVLERFHLLLPVLREVRFAARAR